MPSAKLQKCSVGSTDCQKTVKVQAAFECLKYFGYVILIKGINWKGE